MSTLMHAEQNASRHRVLLEICKICDFNGTVEMERRSGS